MSLYSDTTGPWAVVELAEHGRVIYHAQPESAELPASSRRLVYTGLTSSVAERIAERRNKGAQAAEEARSSA